jgi:hypothetical protein
MSEIYFVVKKKDGEWKLCLIEIGMIHNDLSNRTEKRSVYYNWHVDNEWEAQNYIDIMKNKGDTAEYKIVEGSLKYDFSNINKLNQDKDE